MLPSRNLSLAVPMTLASLLAPPQICPELRATERWQAIEELTDLLVTSGQLPSESRDQALAAVRAREASMSTGIGNHVAIPHASLPRLRRVVAAFGRSAAGLDFSALDNQPVNLVVLFLVPENQFQIHLRALSAIAKFFKTHHIREDLAAAATREDIHALLLRHGRD